MKEKPGSSIAKHQGMLFALGFIFCVNLFVFFPSFFHAMRGDQMSYLFETAGVDSFYDLLNRSYSFCRTREMAPGDQMLFRPGFYFLMACETMMFRYDFVAWQLVSFFLHLVILGQLFFILRRFHPGWLAGAFVLSFSVLFVSQEMVIWHHVSGYMLFAAFLLQVFYWYMEYVFSGQKKTVYLWAMTGLLGLACFTYEFGVLCSLAFAGSLWLERLFMSREERSALSGRPQILLVPAVVYVLWSMADYFTNLRTGVAEIWEFSLGSVGYGLGAVMKIAQQALFLPSLTTILWEDRSKFQPLSDILGHEPGLWQKLALLCQRSLENGWVAANLLYLILLLAFAVLLIFFIGKSRFLGRPFGLRDFQNFSRPRLFILATTAVLLFCYLAMIVAGRFLARGEEELQKSLYYFYFIFLFLGMAGYFVFSFLDRGLNKGRRILTACLGVALMLSSGVNGHMARKFNEKGREYCRGFGRYIQPFNQFVEAHRPEPDFSFDIYWSDTRYFSSSKILPELDGKDYADFLWGKYISRTPKYYLVYSDKNGLKYFRDKNEATQYVRQNLLAEAKNGTGP